MPFLINSHEFLVDAKLDVSRRANDNNVCVITHTHTHTHTLSLSLSLSLSHTHTHTHIHSLAHTHAFLRSVMMTKLKAKMKRHEIKCASREYAFIFHMFTIYHDNGL